MKRLDFLKSLIGIPVAAKVLTQPEEVDMKKILRQAKKAEIVFYTPISSEGSHFEVLPNGNVRLSIPNVLNQDQGRYIECIDESGIVPPQTIKL